MDCNHRFKQRVQELARRDVQRSVFGCELHKYEFGPTLSESELVAIESAYGINFPADYRDYLLTVGNGGVGPGYGLLPLTLPVPATAPRNRKVVASIKDASGRTIYRGEHDDAGANYDPSGMKSTTAAVCPFPLAVPFRSITDEMWAAGIRNWDNRLRSEHEINRAAFAAIRFGDGVLKLAHYGSGIYAVLVLQGVFQGQVWVTDPHVGDYVPASMRADLHDPSVKLELAYARDTGGISFSRWYDHWLCGAETQTS